MIDRNRFSVRTRLTIVHTAVFSGIMLLYIVGSLGFLYLYLRQHQDAALKEDLEVIAQFLHVPLDEKFTSLVQTHDPNKYERFCEVWSTDGTLLFRSPELHGEALGPSPRNVVSQRQFDFHTEQFIDGARWRVVGTIHKPLDRAVYVRLAVSEEPLYDEMYKAAIVLALLAPVVLLLVSLSGYFFAGRVLNPITMMVATARRISASNLNERLPVTNPGDEFGSLATTINNLLERVRHSFEQLKRFTADASHELRTPLTALRSVGEIALQRERTSIEYRETIGSMLEENSRLTNLVDQLLFLSRADGGRLLLHPELIDLCEMLQDVAELMSVLAEEKGQTISVESPTSLSLVADKTLLRQAIMDVIDNAVKYSDSGTILVCAAQKADKMAQIDIEDHGPGIPIEERDNVFERFHRVEEGRPSTSGGTGLGLSIVQWIIHAHAGSVQVLESPHGGTIIRIRIPIAADRQALSSRDQSSFLPLP